MEVDPRFKGKAKVDESVKIYLPTMHLEVNADEDTSLILNKKRNIQATSDRAQVVLTSEEKETSDIAHVKPSKILLPGFIKAQQSAQPMKTSTNVFRVDCSKERKLEIKQDWVMLMRKE